MYAYYVAYEAAGSAGVWALTFLSLLLVAPVALGKLIASHQQG